MVALLWVAWTLTTTFLFITVISLAKVARRVNEDNAKNLALFRTLSTSVKRANEHTENHVHETAGGVTGTARIVAATKEYGLDDEQVLNQDEAELRADAGPLDGKRLEAAQRVVDL